MCQRVSRINRSRSVTHQPKVLSPTGRPALLRLNACRSASVDARQRFRWTFALASCTSYDEWQSTHTTVRETTPLRFTGTHANFARTVLFTGGKHSGRVP